MSLLHDQLRSFAAHLRDPDAHRAPPGIPDRRMAVYRELVFNNLRALLGASFPVIRSTLGDGDWNTLVRSFLTAHRSATPLFTQLGQEFVSFVQAQETQGLIDVPWLAELAHYEWIELALQIADAPLPAHHPHGDLLAEIPLVSPLAWPLAYAWPVHRIGPGATPDAPPQTPTLLLARRDPSGAVRFAELSPLVYRLLTLLDDGDDCSGTATLERLADEAQSQDRDRFLHEGAAMLVRLHDEGTLLGTRR